MPNEYKQHVNTTTTTIINQTEHYENINIINVEPSVKQEECMENVDVSTPPTHKKINELIKKLKIYKKFLYTYFPIPYVSLPKYKSIYHSSAVKVPNLLKTNEDKKENTPSKIINLITKPINFINSYFYSNIKHNQLTTSSSCSSDLNENLFQQNRILSYGLTPFCQFLLRLNDINFI